MRIALFFSGITQDAIRGLGQALASGGHELEAAEIEAERAADLISWADGAVIVTPPTAREPAERLYLKAAEAGRPCTVMTSLDVATAHRFVLGLKVDAERIRRFRGGLRRAAW